MNTQRVLWFFDVISPFAYLAWQEMDQLPSDMPVEFVPLGAVRRHFESLRPERAGRDRAEAEDSPTALLYGARKKLGIEGSKMPPAAPLQPAIGLTTHHRPREPPTKPSSKY